MNNTRLMLACLLGLTLLSGCKRANEQPTHSNSDTSQPPASSGKNTEQANTPVEQDYGYEGYEQAGTAPEPDPYSADTSSHAGSNADGEEQLEVSKYSEPSPYISGAIATYVVITSLSDDITLKTILVNRGNCGVEFPRSSPNLKYGAQYRVYVKASCRPEQIREVEVGTARDTYTFNF